MDIKYRVESDITIRAVDKPIPERQILGIFHSLDSAYYFIEKYCLREDLEENISNGKFVAINIVLGQFEDMIYINKIES